MDMLLNQKSDEKYETVSLSQLLCLLLLSTLDRVEKTLATINLVHLHKIQKFLPCTAATAENPPEETGSSGFPEVFHSKSKMKFISNDISTSKRDNNNKNVQCCIVILLILN